MKPDIPIPWEHLQLTLRRVYEGPPRVSDRNRLCYAHLYLAAWYLKRGSVRVRQEGRIVEAGEGHWVFPRITPRYQDFSPGAEICSLAVDVVWPDGRPLFDAGLPAVFSGNLKETRRLHSIFRTILGLAAQSGEDLGDYLALRAAVHEWVRALHVLFSAHGILPDSRAFLSREQAALLEAVKAWPLYELYSAEKMAASLGMSRSHFERLAVRVLGKSPKRYFDERRLGHAMAMLGAKSVKEVAAEVGFGHASTFSAWFKKHTGVFPRAVREQKG